jgi:hypothetical protein
VLQSGDWSQELAHECRERSKVAREGIVAAYNLKLICKKPLVQATWVAVPATMYQVTSKPLMRAPGA